VGSQTAERFDHVSGLRSRLDNQGWWHSFELPDGTIVEGANSLESLRERVRRFQIPQDLRGKRALDVGTWDGWFAFELERRGASVMAVDVIDNPRFREMHRIYQSKIDYRQIDVYDLTPARVGQFDVVLFMGVLYHLKHPLLGLERVCALTRDMAVLDSFVLQEKDAEGVALDRPVLEFFENDEFGGQTDNWVAPNLPCLLAMCRTAGFARVQLEGVGYFGAAVTCYRKWESASGIAAELEVAMHHTNFGINFDSSKDEYITCRFRSARENLKIADLLPTVGPYGVIPIRLVDCGEGSWECGFKLPPGLAAGWHDVRLGANALRIAVDVPLLSGRLKAQGLSDGVTWAERQLDRSRGNSISAWLTGLPENADRANLRAWIDDIPLAVEWVQRFTAKKEKRQVNLIVPASVPAGKRRVRFQIGNAIVKAGEITVKPG
jgi:tRNA (mo5U34)-methyltransferase